MYIVEQVEGKLVQESNKLFKALKSGDYQTAKKIYQDATGLDAPEIGENCTNWWFFNAVNIVKRFHPEKFGVKLAYIRDDKLSAMRECKIASKHEGGRWDFYYEY